MSGRNNAIVGCELNGRNTRCVGVGLFFHHFAGIRLIICMNADIHRPVGVDDGTVPVAIYNLAAYAKGRILLDEHTAGKDECSEKGKRKFIQRAVAHNFFLCE